MLNAQRKENDPDVSISERGEDEVESTYGNEGYGPLGSAVAVDC